MASQLSQPHGPQALNDLLSHIDRCTIQGRGGGQYVRVDMLKQWWEGGPAARAGPGNRHIDHILEYVYSQTPGPSLPIGPDEISRERYGCVIVFSILLHIGGVDAGRSIHQYQNHRIFDDRLPVKLYELEECKLPYADQFNRAQWAFSPPCFDLYTHHIYPAGTILPICMDEPINPGKGGTATLWQIGVQEEFVTPKLRKKVETCKFEHPKFGSCYQFALKKYGEGHAQLFKNEKEAFGALRGKEGMIQYLCDYEQKENTTSPDGVVRSVVTHNIILEYAELDLDCYFQEKRPPILEGEVAHFWEDMFDVAGAVEKIHDLTVTRGAVEHKYYGWHADIKPDNILIVQEKFKLADPGFARFEKQTDKDRVTIAGGTETYSAPECYRAAQRSSLGLSQVISQVKRTIDIWSLGCVFSIAATWVVLGYDGIRQFRAFRDTAVREAMKKQNLDPNARAEGVKLTRGDYFHDSNDVLQAIGDWHLFLRRFLRNGDTLTSRVLDVVDKQMLKGDPDDRIQAKNLCGILDKLLKEYRAQQRQPLLGSIMQALLRVDEDAPLRPEPSKVLLEGNPNAPRKRRPSQLEPPKKTTHRTEFLRSALHEQGVVLEQDAVTKRISQGGESSHNDRGLHIPDGQGQGWSGYGRADDLSQFTWASGQPTFHLNYTKTGLPSGPPRATRKSQNVFQARYDIQNQKSRWGFGSKKDNFLTKYFSNRDIVFLVDNAGSMNDEWGETINLLEILVMKLKGQDENGMDLYFANGKQNLQNCKDPETFKKKMRQEGVLPVQGVNTELHLSLGKILRRYLKYLQDEMKRKVALEDVRTMTVIVLTDGKWDGEAVFEQIVDFCRDMQKCMKGTLLSMENRLEKRRVSIEFVQLGNDADATARLRRLDNDLPYKGADDIVDTEPSRGDVNKMILGSFVEEFDSRDDDLSMVENFPGPGRPVSRMTMDTTRATNPPEMAPSFMSNWNYQHAPQLRIDRTDTHQTQRTAPGLPNFSHFRR
ncbi:Protein kinase domain-containing protein isoform 1 [Cladophialophora immunda]|nr:Protein kinase domain-containing protein isoform 1 [Cladophialophora immunda]